MDYLGSKYRTSLELWILSKNFLKFCTMKRPNRQMKVIIMVCTKRILFKANWVFLDPKMTHPHIRQKVDNKGTGFSEIKIQLVLIFKKQKQIVIYQLKNLIARCEKGIYIYKTERFRCPISSINNLINTMKDQKTNTVL